ncbi:MAG: hypothetical protein HY843_04665 [Bdellovibrio sp.]|nr:hypothetical protein [Bdellovibrio sp.]
MSRLIRSFVLLSIVIPVLGCSLKSSFDPSMVNLIFKFQNQNSFNNSILQNLSLKQYSPFIDSIPPASLSQFNCLAINIMGSGVFSGTYANNLDTYIQKQLQGQSCAYKGVTSSTFPVDADKNIALKIPAGKDRIIQVIGFSDPQGIYCKSSLPISEIVTPENNLIEGYEIGKAIKDLFKNNEEVSIQNSYDSLPTTTDKRNRNIQCEGLEPITSPNSGSSSGSGSGGSNTIQPSFTPKDIANLRAWYRAGYFTEKGLTDGQNIEINWLDESGNGLSVVSSGESAGMPAPKYFKQRGTNNTPTVHVEGGAHFSASFANGIGTINELTVFAVTKYDSGAIVGEFLGLSSDYAIGGVGVDYFIMGTLGGGNYSVQYNASGTIPTITATQITYSYKIHVATWQAQAATGTTFKYSILGMEMETQTDQAANTVNINLSKYIKIGKATVNYFGGDISEIIIYTRLLTGTEESKIKDYLSIKYNLP